MRSVALAASAEDSVGAEVLLLDDAHCLLDDAFVSVTLDAEVEVDAEEVVVVGAKGLRSALRKAATPAFVLS